VFAPGGPPVDPSWQDSTSRDWAATVPEGWTPLLSAPVVDLPWNGALARGELSAAAADLLPRLSQVCTSSRPVVRWEVTGSGIADAAVVDAERCLGLYWDGTRRLPYPLELLAEGLVLAAYLAVQYRVRGIVLGFPARVVPAIPPRPTSTLNPVALPALLDLLEAAGGSPDPPRTADGWELVLAENVAYLVDDERRWEALEQLRRTIGLEPKHILAATDAELRAVVIGMRPDERISRLRRCAELALTNAPWRAYPGIGAPGAERIDLFSAARPVLSLD
jgi:hypothetical protein